MSADLERLFPDLAGDGYLVTSPEAAAYHCIAWAVGESHRWWQPGVYWPTDPGDDLATLIGLFTSLGYATDDDDGLEAGHEKGALYADDLGEWTHAARQRPDGWWTSKIGQDVDIVHRTPAALEGEVYGKVRAILKRVVRTMTLVDERSHRVDLEASGSGVGRVGIGDAPIPSVSRPGARLASPRPGRAGGEDGRRAGADTRNTDRLRFGRTKIALSAQAASGMRNVPLPGSGRSGSTSRCSATCGSVPVHSAGRTSTSAASMVETRGLQPLLPARREDGQADVRIRSATRLRDPKVDSGQGIPYYQSANGPPQWLHARSRARSSGQECGLPVEGVGGLTATRSGTITVTSTAELP